MSHLNSRHVQIGQAVVDLACHLLLGLIVEGLGEVILVAADDLGGLEHVFARAKGDAVLASPVAGRGGTVTGETGVDALGERSRKAKIEGRP
jgi:hypothetical protein